MRAVNLIPEDLRGSGSGGRAGSGIYVLLGVLAVAVLMVTAYTLTTRSLPDKRASVASLEQQADDAAARAGNLASYTQFATLRQKREETVRDLAASRFDWAHTLHELARVMPASAWLSSVRASVSPTVAVQGGTTDPLRASIASPAIELSGCTKSHDDVARVISNLRRIDGVQRVSLSSAVKNDTSSNSGAVSDGGGDGGDCTRGNARYPKFSLTVFLAAPAGATTTATPSTGGTP
jgi:Tfp pilus assembly protein PilN